DLHCGYCQNWLTSQTLRDPAAEAPLTRITPSEFSALAREQGASTVTSTYNEPLITSEWAVALFREARRHGLRTSYVSNGNGTPAVLEYLRPWVDLYKVDLKSFDDRHYRQLGGKLETVLDTIRLLWEMGFWVEVVTLVVPGFNDREEELRQIARFLAGVSPDIPWHITAFHPDYQMQERGATPVRTLLAACALGKEAGLHYVYAGNIPGAVADWENTRCPQCTTLLIERAGFQVRSYHLTEQGTCPKCGVAIAGRWDASLTRAALARSDAGDRIPRVVRRW
ncbi:radical SAM protein, partial [bacterium]|nr:radical SAM protein [bacterium]